MNALEAFQAPYFFWSLGFVEIKEILWLSKDKRTSNINVCDILLDVCIVTVQSFMHMIYLQVVHECTELSSEQLSEWILMYKKLTGEEVELSNMQRKEERLKSSDVITRKLTSVFISGTGNLVLLQITLCIVYCNKFLLWFPFLYSIYIPVWFTFTLRCCYKQLNSTLPGVQLWSCWSQQGLYAELCPLKGSVFQFNIFFCQSFWVVVKLWDWRGKPNALQVLKTIQEIIYDNLRHKLIQKELESILVSQYVRKTKGNFKKSHRMFFRQLCQK